jgi:MarR family transcriptional regulator for hemolysin
MLLVDEQLSERFIQALHAGGRAWRLALERELKASGLTGAGWSAISALADLQRAGEPGARPPSQTELAQLLGVDGATLVATIDRLAAAGWIERSASRQDRRVKLVVLTSEGRALEEKVRAQADALRRGAVAHLDASQVAAAAAALEQLQHVLERA